jgi:hypothetical protein
MVSYQNVAQYCGAYRLNGIPTSFQKYSIFTAIHCLCYRHKQAQISQKKHAHIDITFTNTNQLVPAI